MEKEQSQEKELRDRVQAECLEARKLQEDLQQRLQEEQAGRQEQEEEHKATLQKAQQEQEAECQGKKLAWAQYELELQEKERVLLRLREEQEAGVCERQRLEAKVVSVVEEMEQQSFHLEQERLRQQEMVAELEQERQARQGQEQEAQEYRSRADEKLLKEQVEKKLLLEAQEKELELKRNLEASLHMSQDKAMLSLMEKVTEPDVSCKDSFGAVNQILKKLGAPIMTNLYYGTVKQLLERISSVMVDREAIQLLVKVVKEALNSGEVIKELEINPDTAGERGLRLLFVLSFVFPSHFLYEDVIKELLSILEHNRDLQVSQSCNSMKTFLTCFLFPGGPLGPVHPLHHWEAQAHQRDLPQAARHLREDLPPVRQPRHRQAGQAGRQVYVHQQFQQHGGQLLPHPQGHRGEAQR